MIKVAVILINYKDYAQRFLKDCIESLDNVVFEKGEFEVFIVDNVTSEETQNDIMRIAPNANLVTSEGNGFGHGNNLGIKKALEKGFNYFYLLNMDTAVEPDFLDKAFETYLKNKNTGIVQSRLMLYDDKSKINSIGNSFHYLGFAFCNGYQDEKYNFVDNQITSASGAGFLFSKEVLDTIGYFTEDFFMYHDDVELSLKARLAGYDIYLSADSVVYHKYEFFRSSSHIYFMERNRWLVLWMFYKIKTLIVLFPALLAMEFGQFLFSIQNKAVKERFKVYKWFFSIENLKKLRVWRKQTQLLRKISDKELMAGFVGEINFQEQKMQHWLLTKVANPVFNTYFKFIKLIIFW